MSDSRRRSSRPASSSTSSHQHSRGSRHGGGSSAPSNRSSSSLLRISNGGSSRNQSRESLAPAAPPSTPAGALSAPSYLHPPASDPGPSGTSSGLGQIYGSSVGARASSSRFSLTDQFAATRSVLDFGFDDGASSIFDAQSVFSVASNVRGAPSIAAGGGGLGGLGVPWGEPEPEEEYLGGAYSTVLEENENDNDDTATIGGRDEYGDDDGSVDQTPRTVRHTPTSSADTTVLDQDPLQFAMPVAESRAAHAPSSSTRPQPAREKGYTPPVAVAAPVYRTYYDLFCLSREHYPPPSAAQIRAAYYRMSRLLNSSYSHGGARSSGGNGANLMPVTMRPQAAAYFMEIQNAFETLVDPIRRLEYDRYLDDLEDDMAPNDDDDNESDPVRAPGGLDEGGLVGGFPQVPPSFVRKDDFQTATDIGVRCAVARARHGLSLPGPQSLTPLDYSLTQVVRVGLPTLRRYTETGLFQLQRRLHHAHRLLHKQYTSLLGHEKQSVNLQTWAPLLPVRCGIPVVSLSASTYALSAATASSDAGSSIVPPLGDRYQPLLPEVLGPANMAQLARTRATGCINLSYRQEFWAGGSAKPGRGPPPPPTVVQVDTEVLPRVAVTTRVAHMVTLPPAVQRWEGELLGSRHSSQPLHIELMVQSGKASSTLPPAASTSPGRVGLGISRRVVQTGGHVFLCADSGNNWWPGLQPLSLASSLLAPLIPPMVEFGYSLSPHELGLRAGRPLTGPADRGLKGTDLDMDTLAGVGTYGGYGVQPQKGPVPAHRTYTVSAAVTGHGSLAAYVRYGRTVFLTPLWRRPPSRAGAALKPGAFSKQRQKQLNTPQRAVRIEAELCAADFFVASDGYLAVRALAPVRWWGIRNRWTSGMAFRSTTPASTTPPKLGIEVALSSGGLLSGGSNGCVHVSLYWSCLGQRIKLPFLLLPLAGGSSSGATSLFVWAAVVPAAAIAVRELLGQVQWQRYGRAAVQWLGGRMSGAGGSSRSTLSGDYTDDALVYDEQEEQAITRHRAEADELTMVLAAAVDAQRLVEQRILDAASTASAKKNKLVILSAKYGVALADDPDDGGGGDRRHDIHMSGLGSAATLPPPVTAMASRNGWAPDYEVADVTVAVSALVMTDSDDSRDGGCDYLLIPGGLRKSRLLGFWDPAPGYGGWRHRHRDGTTQGKKVLHVRYLWQGQERIAEAGDCEELRLPE